MINVRVYRIRARRVTLEKLPFPQRPACSRRELLRRFGCLPGFLAAAPLAAQQPELPKLSVTTRVVQVSVAVHDKNGRPANGLSGEDFTVLDNGVPQTIASFVRSMPDDTAAAPAPGPGGTRGWSNRGGSQEGSLRTVTAVVLDGLNTNVRDQSFAKQKVLAFLRKLRPGDSVALYFIADDLRVLHEFTDNAAALVRTVEDLESRLLSRWARERSPAAIRGALKHDRAAFTLEALQAIARRLSRIPGRKNLVWVTSGFPMLIIERERRQIGYIHNMIPEMEAAAKAIGDADVAVYPVSAMGLVGVPQMSAEQPSQRGGRRGSTTLGPAITHSRQAGPLEDMMNVLADQTGGRAFYERNDLDAALQQSVDDLAATYTLTFHPSHNQWNGEYRQIRVQVKGKGLKARHRPGYLAAPDGPPDSRDVDAVLADALGNPLDSTAIGLAVSQESIEADTATLRIEIEAATLTLEPAAGRWKGEFLLAVVHGDGEPDVQRISVDLSAERYQEVLKTGAAVSKSVPRFGAVRVFVVDIKSRRVGSVGVR